MLHEAPTWETPQYQTNKIYVAEMRLLKREDWNDKRQDKE